MKKLILALLFLSTPAWADTVSLHTVSNDNTMQAINDNFTDIAGALNGDIDGSTDGGATVANLAADTVYEINMADDANPRVYTSEALNVTVDTIASGAASSQGALVDSGCTPATDTDLTSDVSACVAYINGYRVSKSATAQTYDNNTTTYLWLSQNGNYTQSTNANSTIANSALLASVVTSGGQITTVNDLANRRLPGLILPSHYRTGLFLSRDSTTTLTVLPGSAEINSTMVNKTSTTTLTISTAGDWAGGSSLRAADTFGFVGMDDDGNLKMHTTAPTHDNYAVSTTSGKKRYATWSSTVYRILGWFYMDGNGSGNVEVASNIKEFDVPNAVISTDGAITTFAATAYAPVAKVRFYASGSSVKSRFTASPSDGGGNNTMFVALSRDMALTGSCAANPGQCFVGSERRTQDANAAMPQGIAAEYLEVTGPNQGTHTYNAMARVDSGTFSFSGGKTFIVEE